MIITRIQGGLGNQMFQYAMGRALSYSQKNKLYLNTLWLEKSVEGHLDRSFLLNNFNIKASIVTQKEFQLFVYGSFWTKFNKQKKTHIKQLVFDEPLKKFSDFKNLNLIIKPQTYTFYPDIFTIKNRNIFLDGYWQSFKYFSSIKSIIKMDFEIKRTLSSFTDEVLKTIQSCISISVHFRKTDYTNTDFGNKYFKPIPLFYYEKALEIFESKFDKISIFVFSDDIEWCKVNFSTRHETHFISSKDPVEDLYLMSCCKHNIIANSTFSWWAAWLNDNSEKIVVSPSKWFQNIRDQNMDDILPEEWVKIEI